MEPLPPTQVRYPWRAALRTLLAIVLAAAPLAPAIWTAATGQDTAAATGLAAAALALAAVITRVMADPHVNRVLTQAGLGPTPPPAKEVPRA